MFPVGRIVPRDAFVRIYAFVLSKVVQVAMSRSMAVSQVTWAKLSMIRTSCWALGTCLVRHRFFVTMTFSRRYLLLACSMVLYGS